MIFLSLGSNLASSYGDRFENINIAITYLETYGIKVLKKSSFFETPSYPDDSNPKFINSVVMIETHLNPTDLMSVLLFIEKKLGRVRNKKNDPRTCDIDIIDYKGKVLKFSYNNEDFILPHKEMPFRNFVLFPLKEVFPEWVHPQTNENIDLLISKLSKNEKNYILKIKKN